MASDVNEQVFNEKELYRTDLVGEDDDIVVPTGRPSPPLPHLPGVPLGGQGGSSSSSAPPPRSRVPGSTEPPASGRGSAPTPVKPPGSSGGARALEKRSRKRPTERAAKIVYCLETKYDVLTEVCTEFENWKEAPSQNYDFDLLWCDTAIPADRFMKLKQYQKMNHFVGMSSITRKNNLGRNLLRMRKQFPKEYKFFPDTWILPTDLSDFKLQFSGSKGKTFIIKPDNGCQGKGIFLVRDVEKVPVDFSTTYVAQRYVNKPFLLDGFKFDLRLYVLVVGCDPLRIFLHRRGLVRLASEPYAEPTSKNLQQSCIHLTNYAINKLNPNFEENTDPDDASDGHKRSWEAVQAYLRQEGYDVDGLMAEIEDLIIKTLIAVQPNLSHFYHSCQPDDLENAMCFEILGFDVMLDNKLQPWLLEVNHAPSFATESELDRLVKTEVLRDTFVLLNFSPEARRQKKREMREKMEQRAMGTSKKQSMDERMLQEQDIARERTAWEDEHLNNYKRLYPSEAKEKEYMQIHEAAINIWEMLMGGTSRRTVRLTREQPAPAAAEEEGGAAAGKEEAAAAAPPGRSAGAASARKGGAAGPTGEVAGSKDPPATQKRTPEQLKEVVERLMAGYSARPRPGGGARRRGRGETAPPVERTEEEEEDAQQAACADSEELVPSTTQLQPKYPSSSASRPDVQVGDIIKVQTNLGWETVTVRAKRANGKIDIQFRDGEYMRSVLPRILRETPAAAGAASGAPPAEADGVEPRGVGSGGGHPMQSPPVPATGRSARSGATPGPPGAGNPSGPPPGGGAAGSRLPPAALGGGGGGASALHPPVVGDLLALTAAGTGSSPRPGQGVPDGTSVLHATNEALATLDAQLSAQMRGRRAGGAGARSSQVALTEGPASASVAAAAAAAASGAAPPGVAGSSSTLAGNGRGTLRLPTSSLSNVAPSLVQEAPTRVHEVRLRQQLQQLINVRPIIAKRGPGTEGAEVQGTPRSVEARQVTRRHTFGEK